jgi:hypothetical protein
VLGVIGISLEGREFKFSRVILLTLKKNATPQAPTPTIKNVTMAMALAEMATIVRIESRGSI